MKIKNTELINIEMIDIGMIFKGSLLLFVFLCGIMTGSAVEETRIREKEKIVNESEIQQEKLLASWANGIAVYFDSWEEGKVNIIVNNYGENKLQEVSIVNMEIDGAKVESYSDLGGVRSGEIKRCEICYAGETLAGQNDMPDQIKGELYVRGSMDYVYQKVSIII